MMSSRSSQMTLLFMLGAASCSTTADVLTENPVDETSSVEANLGGSRLKVVRHRWKGEDGTRMTLAVNRFYDTKLKVECSFKIAEDGTSRCLPVRIDYPESSNEIGPGYFLDSACTQLVAAFDKARPVPEYAPHPPFAVTGFYFSVTTIEKLGSVVTPATLYQGFGSCRALSSTELSNALAQYNLHPTTAMAATEFVKGELESVIIP